MKKVVLSFAVLAMLATVSCKQEENKNQNDTMHEGESTEMHDGHMEGEHMDDEHMHEQREMDGDHMDGDHMNEQGMDQAKNTVTFSEDALAQTFNAYLTLKDALVATNADQASEAASELASVSANEEIKNKASELASKKDVEEQRALFAELGKLVEAEISGKIESGEIYKQYCPMAFNNQGGYWLSNEKAIMNPYFGDKMLKCGAVKETIK
ncbi:DUF3347 domain-containing protein [Robertkochia aurantiaca]|uniref:DUF3347 domain-containing protein n=1 Tax=Robertkochia aurantiaca TaxID=2873700 RepID=UPI001CCD6732|nr:DUF3347 domain-containing protein [Robertkochia sp. 3YJGBD-33]